MKTKRVRAILKSMGYHRATSHKEKVYTKHVISTYIEIDCGLLKLMNNNSLRMVKLLDDHEKFLKSIKWE